MTINVEELLKFSDQRFEALDKEFRSRRFVGTDPEGDAIRIVRDEYAKFSFFLEKYMIEENIRKLADMD